MADGGRAASRWIVGRGRRRSHRVNRPAVAGGRIRSTETGPWRGRAAAEVDAPRSGRGCATAHPVLRGVPCPWRERLDSANNALRAPALRQGLPVRSPCCPNTWLIQADRDNFVFVQSWDWLRQPLDDTFPGSRMIIGACQSRVECSKLGHLVRTSPPRTAHTK